MVEGEGRTSRASTNRGLQGTQRNYTLETSGSSDGLRCSIYLKTRITGRVTRVRSPYGVQPTPLFHIPPHSQIRGAAGGWMPMPEMRGT